MSRINATPTEKHLFGEIRRLKIWTNQTLKYFIIMWPSFCFYARRKDQISKHEWLLCRTEYNTQKDTIDKIRLSNEIPVWNYVFDTDFGI